MGTPDTLVFPCPHCGKEICIQTKPGYCESYKWETIEDWDVARFTGPEQCYECGKWCAIGIDITYSNKRIEKLDKDPFEEDGEIK